MTRLNFNLNLIFDWFLISIIFLLFFHYHTFYTT